MAKVVLVSVLGPDRVGLISAVAGTLYDAGVNLRDTTFAALGSGAEFTAVCEVPAHFSMDETASRLRALPELDGAEVDIRPFTFDPRHGPLGRVTHRIEVSGGDQLGLVARLADIFTQFGANIVRLDSQKLPGERGDYMARFSVSIPADRQESCLAAVANTAGSLRLDCQVDEVGPEG
ncbi:glycine cleavage system protein R [Arenibaculum pallidiluteum]|uniref:glycine cleavage system protein R n=1 Tax=Arenibaculum pallidiluteum TaxID=2812559 RepID=UPI001A96D1F2|nr:ACT domain-containing protein [Arenibaculum pallidiluteum]